MRPLYWTILTIARAAIHLLWWPRYIGRENLPTGPYLICANHRSWFDPPLVAIIIPREVGFLAKAELFKNPLFGKLIWSLNARPIKRGVVDRGAIDQVLAHLKKNVPVVTFPEGTRSRPGSKNRYKAGGALLAVYSAGLAIPFLLTALAFTRMTTAFAFVKRHYAVIMAAGGVVLIAMGVLVWTGELFRLNSEVQGFFDDLGLNIWNF